MVVHVFLETTRRCSVWPTDSALVPLAMATDQANHEIAGHVADVVASKVPIGSRVGILGLSYKPNTPVIEESQGVLIAQILLQRGFEVVAYDPVAIEAAPRYSEKASNMPHQLRPVSSRPMQF